MAGDWIKMRTSLVSERAVMVICDMTGLDEFSVIGRLHAIWTWAGEHTTNGTVRGVTLKTIDRVTRCENFSGAMVSVGWLEEATGGGVKFSRWNKYNSKAAKKRALDADRQARQRERNRSKQRDGKRDEIVTRHAQRGEERREEKNKETTTTSLERKPADAVDVVEQEKLPREEISRLAKRINAHVKCYGPEDRGLVLKLACLCASKQVPFLEDILDSMEKRRAGDEIRDPRKYIKRTVDKRFKEIPDPRRLAGLLESVILCDQKCVPQAEGEPARAATNDTSRPISET